MALKAVIKTIDGLSDEIAGLYEKDGDVFVLSLDGLESHPKAQGLSNSVKAIRTEKKTLEKQLEELQTKFSGIDVEKIKDIDLDEYEKQLAELGRLKQEQEKQQKQKLKDEAAWEKLEQQLTSKQQEQIESLEKKYTTQIDQFKKESQAKEEKMLTSLKQNLKDKELTKALAKAGGNIPILTPHIAPFVDIRETDSGLYNVVVIDADGNPRKDDSGQLLGIEALVGEFKEKPEFQGDGLFKVDQQTGGSGSAGNRGQNDSQNNPFAKDSFNLTQQALLKKADPQKYDRLKKAAAGEDK
jgi:hypothetical protein